ncbi:MAG: hypothetical protein DRJ62_00790 [Thermoprotei archaeon]|nr:MAG: hypothetical protein DRJ62_00790 [Thermoprotei archaeon]
MSSLAEDEATSQPSIDTLWMPHHAEELFKDLSGRSLLAIEKAYSASLKLVLLRQLEGLVWRLSSARCTCGL